MTTHILIVEDDRLLQETYSDNLGEKFIVESAYTLEQAERLFSKYKSSLAAVVMDACVPGYTPNTPPLVRFMRQSGFERPIIATSGDPDFQKELIKAGCSHSCGKEAVITTLQAMLS